MTRPAMRLVTLVLALIVWTPARADACESVTPYELFERAHRVVTGKVTSRDRRGAVIAVDATLKGSAGPTVKVIAATGLCDADLTPDSRRLVFLDSRGAVLGGLVGDLPLEATDTDPSWPALLTRWANASDDKARLEVVLRVIEQPERSFGRNTTGEFLANTPRLLAMIDAAARRRIASSLAGNRWRPNYVILILFRLRAPELAKLLDADPTAWSYRDEMRAVLAADRFGAVTDRAALAEVMTAKGSSVAARTAALDRCEMLRGEQLHSFVGYLYDAARDPGAVDWKRLAAACKR